MQCIGGLLRPQGCLRQRVLRLVLGIRVCLQYLDPELLPWLHLLNGFGLARVHRLPGRRNFRLRRLSFALLHQLLHFARNLRLLHKRGDVRPGGAIRLLRRVLQLELDMRLRA